MILTQATLNQAKCDNPECNDEHDPADAAIFMRSNCHFESPFWVSYEGGILTVQCSVCNTPIADIAVAP